MKKIFILFLLISFLNIDILPCYAKTVKVKANTPVTFTVSEVKSSADTTEGEKIAISIDEDVIVNGVSVFKTGGKGFLYINEVQKRAFWGQGGKIIITKGKIYDANGTARRIEFTKEYVGKDTTWSVVVATLGLATIILFPLGLFGFVRGKDAKTVPNIQLEATTLDEFNFTPSL